MQARLWGSVIVAALVVGAGPAHAIKKVPYPQVRVEVFDPYTPDPAFQAMRNAFRQATASRNANALFALVGPSFAWTVQGALAGDLDLGRDALHNFKVVFGFREFGKDTDGGVKDGPFWDALAAFAEDGTYYAVSDSENLVCSPIGADIADDAAIDQAETKLETPEESVDWYFTLRNTPVARTRGDTGPPLETVGKVALPVLETYPQGAASPTHMEVLLPSGKSGWVPASAVRPLNSERLCYAKNVRGEWKIVAYDQLEAEEASDEQ